MRRLEAVQQTLMQLKLLEEDFRFKFKALLEGYMKLVEEGPIVLVGARMSGSGLLSPRRRGSSRVAREAGTGEREPEIDDSPTSETIGGRWSVADEAVTAGRVRPAPCRLICPRVQPQRPRPPRRSHRRDCPPVTPEQGRQA